MPERRSSKPKALRAEEVADYVESMARELKGLVEPLGMPTLAYLLDLVRAEASARGKGAQNDSSLSSDT